MLLNNKSHNAVICVIFFLPAHCFRQDFRQIKTNNILYYYLLSILILKYVILLHLFQTTTGEAHHLLSTFNCLKLGCIYNLLKIFVKNALCDLLSMPCTISQNACKHYTCRPRPGQLGQIVQGGILFLIFF
jgi:hypothetical protein